MTIKPKTELSILIPTYNNSCLDLIQELNQQASLLNIKYEIIKDEIEALKAIDDVINAGKDLYNFLWEVIKYFKDILILKTTNKLELYSLDEIEEIKKLADLSEEQFLLDTIYLLSDVENDIKWSSQKTIMFQTGIIKACRKKVFINSDTSELEKRLLLLEEKVEELKNNQNVTEQDSYKETPKEIKKIEKNKEEINEKNNVSCFANANESWKIVMETLKQNGKIRLYTALVNTRVNEISDMVWEIEFPNGLTSFNEKILQDATNQKDLVMQIFKATGKEVHLKYKDTKDKKPEKPNNSPIGDLGIDINIID